MTERTYHTKKTVLREAAAWVFPRVGGESRTEQVIFSLVTFLGAALFAAAEGAFGACPFALALLSAVHNRTVLVFLGSAVGIAIAGGGTAPVYIGLFALLFLFRFLLSSSRQGNRILPAVPAPFFEPPALRVAAGSAVACLAGVYQVAVGGTDAQSLLYALSMVLSVPVLTFLFYPVFSCNLTMAEILGRHKVNVEERLPAFGKYRELVLLLSLASLGAVFVYSLSGFSLFGFSFAYMAAAFFTLTAAARRGAGTGALVGILLVLPTSVLHAPAFLVLGLVSGLLFRFGSMYALFFGTAAEGILLGVLSGLNGFLSVFPESMIAATVTWPVLHTLMKKRTATAQPETVVCYNKNHDLRHVRRLSLAFLELSSTFGKMAACMRRPNPAEVNAIAQSAVLSRCSLCEKRDACSHAGSPTLSAAVKELSSRIARGERDLSGVFPDTLSADCGYLDTLTHDILSESAERLRERQENGASDLLSADYAMLASILSATADHDERERAEDRRLSQELLSALEEHGGFRGSVTVFGDRQKEILVSGSSWEGKRLSVEEIRTLFESLSLSRLSEPSFDFGSGQMAIETHTVPRHTVVFRSSALPGGKEMSGDMVRSFGNDEGYAYVLLSDGMGSGKTAAITAELVGSYLEELLSAGVSADTALTMLNQVIKQKGIECSATVDLLEVDLLYSRATFLKSGAATSYVRRGRDVFRIRSKTVPIGLLQKVDAEKIHFDVQTGDVIVLLSDGVSQVPEDAPWLVSLLTDGWEEDLDVMTGKIITAAREAGRSDDMTVGLLRIENAENR